MPTEFQQSEHVEGHPAPPPPEMPQQKSVKASNWYGKILEKLFGKKTEGGEQHPPEEPSISAEGGEQHPPEEPSISYELPEIVTSSVDAALNATLSTIAQAEQAAEGEPAVQQELAQLHEETQRITAETLRKVGEQLGSNRGGWYEDQRTGERYYVKLYDNPDQARIEFIANAIYEKLSIQSVRSELLEMDGKLAIASRELPSPAATTAEQQHASADVRGGFIADAYLANWDVVGLVHDNIVRGGDGRDYRVDNGGSLTFRARGGPKDYPADAIPEIETMRNPSYPAGRVFEGLTNDELRNQAEHLAHSLTSTDIDTILERSGLTGPQTETIRAGLVGRRRVLMERFGISEQQSDPSARTAIAAEKLRAQFEQLKSVELRPRVSVLADSSAIENQQVDIIEHPERYDVTFKLTAGQYEKICAILQNREQRGRNRSAKFTYDSSDTGRNYELSDAWELRTGGMRILISKAKESDGREVRSALGLVRIEVPRTGNGPMPADMGERIHRVLQRLFRAEGGFLPPTPEAEREYKWQRYAWHHKLDASGAQPPDWQAVEERLERQEVAPEHFTMVDPGRHREYAGRSPFAVIHNIQHPDAIAKIIRAGGLLSTHERYRRGLILGGMSSTKDLQSGGGDSVFTRTMTEAGLAQTRATEGWIDSGITIVLDPAVLDRTDWYAYEQDLYGGTNPVAFSSRQSPEELFNRQRDSGWRPGNEQMFRTGIGTKHIRAIVCRPSGWQEETRTILTKAGVTEVAGTPIDELIRRGARALRTALQDAGIERVGGSDPVAFTEAQQHRIFTDLLKEWLTDADWEAIQKVRPFADRAALFALDTVAIMSVLHNAGLDGVGTRPLEDFADVNVGEAVRASGITEIAGQSAEAYVLTHSTLDVIAALRAQGVTELREKRTADILRAANASTLAELSFQLQQDHGSDAFAEYVEINKFIAAVSEQERENPLAVASAIHDAGIRVLGGARVTKLIAGDRRDEILDQLRDAGITEINGRPIEDVVIYAKRNIDLIDIAQGNPPREKPSGHVPAPLELD